MTKRVNIDVFHILKSVVDARVAAARPLVARANAAAARLPDLERSLEGLYDWENSMSRYETPHYEPGEDTPTDLEIKIADAKRTIARATQAKQDLEFAGKFNATYRLALIYPQIQAIKTDLREAEYWQEHWNGMYNLVDSDETRDIDERERAKAYYACECENARKNILKLKNKLFELQNVRE